MKVLFSVIVPFKGELFLLKRLLDSIPDIKDIEVLVIDNNKEYVAQEVCLDRTNVKSFYLENARGAGHARNVGMKYASGKWFLFADADDWYNPGAFNVFNQYADSNADIIYFNVNSCYSDSLQPAHRGDYLSALIKRYDENDVKSQNDLRYKFISPCAKMIKRELILREQIAFEERVAANDVWFSIYSGFYAPKIMSVDISVYCITSFNGSITTVQSIQYIRDRFQAGIKVNRFLKEKNLGKYQVVLLPHLVEAAKLDRKYLKEFLRIVIQNRVNPLVGWWRVGKLFRYPRRYIHLFRMKAVSKKRESMFRL